MEDWLSSTAARGLSVHAGDRPAVGGGFRLSPADTSDSCLLVDGDRTVLLNETAAEIIARCDGKHTVAELIHELRSLYRGSAEAEIAEAVQAFLDHALAKGWIRIGTESGAERPEAA